jgi:hypothetical protein
LVHLRQRVGPAMRACTFAAFLIKAFNRPRFPDLALSVAMEGELYCSWSGVPVDGTWKLVNVSVYEDKIHECWTRTKGAEGNRGSDHRVSVWLKLARWVLKRARPARGIPKHGR